MTNFVLSDIGFDINLFKKLNIEITKSTQQIAYIASGGITKGVSYQRAIKKFEQEIEKGLDETTLFTWNEVLYIVNEVATNKQIFNILMEYEEFETFILIIKKYEKLSIYKKLFYIYFNYYNTLKKDGAINVLQLYLKRVLRHYKGNDKYIANLALVKQYIFGNLIYLLDYYNNDYDVIKIDIKLQDEFEFSKVLLNLKILRDLKSLKYDEESSNIFSSIINRKDMYFDKDLLLKEYIVRVLLDRAIEEQQPFPNWQKFILQLIGDPRSTAMYSATMGSWSIIGEYRKEFFIRTLSKDDLKLFLDVLSDSVLDTNYHYRKAFWIQFLDKVIFAKIMIGADAYIILNDKMKDKFKLNNDSYGRLQGLSNQSAIYIDFGNIKIIEFTHSGKVRGYSECPINLHQKYYDTKELNVLQRLETNLFSIIHASPRTYTWQRSLLEYMNQYLNTNITLQDIYIESDKHKVNKYIHTHKKKIV